MPSGDGVWGDHRPSSFSPSVGLVFVLQAFRDQEAEESHNQKGKTRSTGGVYPPGQPAGVRQGLADEEAMFVLETAMHEGSHTVCATGKCAY